MWFVVIVLRVMYKCTTSVQEPYIRHKVLCPSVLCQFVCLAQGTHPTWSKTVFLKQLRGQHCFFFIFFPFYFTYIFMFSKIFKIICAYIFAESARGPCSLKVAKFVCVSVSLHITAKGLECQSFVLPQIVLVFLKIIDRKGYQNNFFSKSQLQPGTFMKTPLRTHNSQYTPLEY